MPVAQMVKNLPAIQESHVQYLGWEDPVEKEVATHSNTLAQRVPWLEEPGRLQSMGLQRVELNWATNRQNKNKMKLHSQGLNESKIRSGLHKDMYLLIIIMYFNKRKKWPMSMGNVGS